MFRKKYTVSLLDSKWLPIKRNVKMEFIPKTDEYVWLDNKYFIVINIVHSITDKYEIFIIVEEKFGETPVTN